VLEGGESLFLSYSYSYSAHAALVLEFLSTFRSRKGFDARNSTVEVEYE